MHTVKRLNVIFLVAATAFALAGGGARAQPAPPASDTRAQAGAFYARGNGYQRQKEWSKALVQYVESLKLQKTPAAMVAAAQCYAELDQYDKAYDAYQDVLHTFPDLSGQVKGPVEDGLRAIEGKMGTLVFPDAPPGAVVEVDGFHREVDGGKIPLRWPLPVLATKHTVRVTSNGIRLLETRIDVDPGQPERALLIDPASKDMGLLHVDEQHGWRLDVFVDGKPQPGATPWDGPVPPGRHTVRVHGHVGVDALAECKPATAPVQQGVEVGSQEIGDVEVTAYQVAKPPPLEAKPLDGSLRVEATPAEATVSIDGEVKGFGVWEQRLSLDREHTVRVTLEGYLPHEERVTLEPGRDKELPVRLVRDTLFAELHARRTTRLTAAGTAYGVGALGLGVFGVAGALALHTVDEVKATCAPLRPATTCPTSQQANVQRASALGTAATAGLVVGGIGVAAGSLVLVFYPADAPHRAPTTGQVTWSAGVGIGGFEVGGGF